MVSLSTALYEKTYKNFIDNDKLSDWIKKIDNNFLYIKEIIVSFNNISHSGYLECQDYLNSLKFRSRIKTQINDELTENIITKFKLPLDYRESQGYFYSVANFSQLLLSSFEYVMYICEDISIINFCPEFIPLSIKTISEDSRCLSTTMNACQKNGMCPALGERLPIGFTHEGFTLDSESEPGELEELILRKRDSNIIGNSEFWISDGFTDHLYLSKKSNLIEVNYCQSNNITNRKYPYAGESFEKRINAHMLNNGFYRYIHKNSHYSHVGWPLYLSTIDLNLKTFIPEFEYIIN